MYTICRYIYIYIYIWERVCWNHLGVRLSRYVSQHKHDTSVCFCSDINVCWRLSESDLLSHLTSISGSLFRICLVWITDLREYDRIRCSGMSSTRIITQIQIYKHDFITQMSSVISDNTIRWPDSGDRWQTHDISCDIWAHVGVKWDNYQTITSIVGEYYTRRDILNTLTCLQYIRHTSTAYWMLILMTYTEQTPTEDTLKSNIEDKQ